MQQQKKLQIYSILKLMTMISVIILGFLFVFQTLKIYIDHEEQIFNVDNISKALLILLPSIIFAVLLIIVTGVFSYFVQKEKCLRIKITNEQKYQTITNNFKIIENDIIIKEKKIRLIINIVSLTIISLCILFISFYLFNPKNYNTSSDINKQVIKGFIYFSPWLLIMLLVGIVRLILIESSYLRSNQSISKNNPKVKPLIKNQKKYLLLSVQLSLLSVAIFLIVFGAINGGSIDVLKKAIAICSECIGLG